MRALPVVVVAVLLFVAPVAGGVSPAATGADDAGTVNGDYVSTTANAIDGPTDTTSVDPESRTFRVLSTPPGIDPTTGDHHRNANFGTAVGLAAGEVDAAIRTETTIQRIESAETNAERQRRILAAINEVEQDEVSLDSRQTAAIDAHASGDLTDRELLDELVRIAAVATEFDARLDVLDELSEETEGFSAPSRLDELQVQLQVYEGPVRDRAVRTVRGDADDTEIRVESGPNAVVLATIEDGEYVRESFRRDRWDRGGGTLSSEAAIDIASASYPETAALREPDAFGAGSVQRITVPHEFGTLRAFVSGGSERVFVEHQWMDLDGFPDTETGSLTEDGFDVTVNRSYSGGPVTVTVNDAESGDPVSGVTVTKSVGGGDSDSIGTTDENGVVRTLSPTGAYRITVIDEPRVAVVDGIQPLELPRLTDDVDDSGGTDDIDGSDGGT
ncbi:hypothetical protein J2751_001358 [Halorubrum alkaliphilum]|uniref:Uncharacterized protein n=1 Tax=Halorubrum alkaliphilum TaxID=261290 RepID=A0A8T4GFB9_9EURY|nr:hypothetical protein [Halorubrum alkaliphilum]MBP1922350.1 hypothetical protein [Halorubrum alkaliphilum]